ncbi:interferon regulatory factor 7 isoform X2 [Struthio camelus]|uniref:interferon regulatory factor 7 isoform X2 n=1 Tax=Struthio camelus TaxID=8801 RepID=UPI0036040091
MESEGDALKLRFGPWLLRAVSSGAYRGLRWVDGARTAFRVPWKHNARKDVTTTDVEIFKDWAKASGRYRAELEDPARWKTNFRCALRSTRMFVLLEDQSKSGEDPHKVYGIAATADCLGPPAGEAAAPQLQWTQQQQLEFDFQDLSLETDGIGIKAERAGGEGEQDARLDALQWVMQQCDLDHQAQAWAAAPGGGLDVGEPCGPGPDEDTCIPALQHWAAPVAAGRLPPAAGLLEVQSAAGDRLLPLARHPGPDAVLAELAPGDVLLYPAAAEGPWEAPAAPWDAGLVPPAAPCPAALLHGNAGGIPPNLDISIFYRGKLFHHEEVGSSRCLLAYQTADPDVPLDLPWLVQFPSPASLADQKQRHFTEELLQNTGLLLEQRDNKIYAQRLKKCKVFWALSRQLDVGNLSPKLLCRNQETEIFDFEEFCAALKAPLAELRDFRDYRRARSPDFTIFLCFGQCFSKAKPKESKLILVKGRQGWTGTREARLARAGGRQSPVRLRQAGKALATAKGAGLSRWQTVNC